MFRTLGPRLQEMVSVRQKVKQRTGDQDITAEYGKVTAYRFQQRYN